MNYKFGFDCYIQEKEDIIILKNISSLNINNSNSPPRIRNNYNNSPLNNPLINKAINLHSTYPISKLFNISKSYHIIIDSFAYKENENIKGIKDEGEFLDFEEVKKFILANINCNIFFTFGGWNFNEELESKASLFKEELIKFHKDLKEQYKDML